MVFVSTGIYNADFQSYGQASNVYFHFPIIVCRVLVASSHDIYSSRPALHPPSTKYDQIQTYRCIDTPRNEYRSNDYTCRLLMKRAFIKYQQLYLK